MLDNTILMRYAKQVFATALRHQGHRLGHYKASEASEAAKALLKTYPEIHALADKHHKELTALCAKLKNKVVL